MVRKVTNHDVKDDYKLLAVLGEGYSNPFNLFPFKIVYFQ